jgi:hypothetical protein
VWDNLGRTTNLNPMATALQYSYANLSLLFARYHAKIILYTLGPQNSGLCSIRISR